MRALITGAAGLVGSFLAKKLIEQGARVFCVDDLSLGSLRHLEDISTRDGFDFAKVDVSQSGWHEPLKHSGFDLMVHLAANSDISLSHKFPETDYSRTLKTTFETLVAARALKVKNFMFSSSSAVYGAEPAFPTPETSPAMHPVSIYGAAKLASESFISAFVENYAVNAWVYRFGNVVGEKLTHGVIYDFIRRLIHEPTKLSVLGNGAQNKTYIDVEDCVEGMLCGFEKSPAGKSHKQRFQIFNLSTTGSTTVKEIAEEASRRITNGHAKIEYQSSDVGWVGDVPKTSLSVEKILSLGWRPRYDSTPAVFRAIQTHYDWTQKN
ncbi:MAG: NAD-dependent epimerase/dehydratase family protein [Bdellovibrionota bacterium]